MAAAWLGPDKGSKPAVVLAGGILGQTLVQRDVAFTSPDRPETALRLVSHIGRETSSTAQTAVAMAGPGNFEPECCFSKHPGIQATAEQGRLSSRRWHTVAIGVFTVSAARIRGPV